MKSGSDVTALQRMRGKSDVAPTTFPFGSLVVKPSASARVRQEERLCSVLYLGSAFTIVELVQKNLIESELFRLEDQQILAIEELKMLAVFGPGEPALRGPAPEVTLDGPSVLRPQFTSS